MRANRNKLLKIILFAFAVSLQSYADYPRSPSFFPFQAPGGDGATIGAGVPSSMGTADQFLKGLPGGTTKPSVLNPPNWKYPKVEYYKTLGTRFWIFNRGSTNGGLEVKPYQVSHIFYNPTADCSHSAGVASQNPLPSTEECAKVQYPQRNARVGGGRRVVRSVGRSMKSAGLLTVAISTISNTADVANGDKSISEGLASVPVEAGTALFEGLYPPNWLLPFEAQPYQPQDEMYYIRKRSDYNYCTERLESVRDNLRNIAKNRTQNPPGNNEIPLPLVDPLTGMNEDAITAYLNGPYNHVSETDFYNRYGNPEE